MSDRGSLRSRGLEHEFGDHDLPRVVLEALLELRV